MPRSRNFGRNVQIKGGQLKIYVSQLLIVCGGGGGGGDNTKDG